MHITIFMFLRELWSLKTLHERNQDVLVLVNSIHWLQTIASCQITCQKSIFPSRTHLHKPHHSPVGRALASLALTPSTNWPPKTCALVQSIYITLHNSISSYRTHLHKPYTFCWAMIHLMCLRRIEGGDGRKRNLQKHYLPLTILNFHIVNYIWRFFGWGFELNFFNFKTFQF
jgi:hypothetical protein